MRICQSNQCFRWRSLTWFGSVFGSSSGLTQSHSRFRSEVVKFSCTGSQHSTTKSKSSLCFSGSSCSRSPLLIPLHDQKLEPTGSFWPKSLTLTCATWFEPGSTSGSWGLTWGSSSSSDLFAYRTHSASSCWAARSSQPGHSETFFDLIIEIANQPLR